MNIMLILQITDSRP